MKQRRSWKAWRACVLAGALVFVVGGLAPREAPAARGFGVKSDDDREKRRAEQRQVEERRGDQEAREAQRRAEQEQQRAAERAREAEQARQARERATREAQASAERERAVRAERDRAAREAQARAEQERAARAAAEREQAAREAQARAERERAAREATDRAVRSERPKRGFGVREPPQPRSQPSPGRDGEGTQSPERDGRAAREPDRNGVTAAPQPSTRPRGWGVREETKAHRNGSLDRYFQPGRSNPSYEPPREGNPRGDGNRAYREAGRGGDGNRAYREPGRRDGRYRDGNQRHTSGVRPHTHDCLYDVIYIPVPYPVVQERILTEVVVLPPEREIVVVPERPRVTLESPEDPAIDSPSERLAHAATVEEILADIERAWLEKDADLLLRHAREERPIEIYRDGEFTTSLSALEFREKTRAAMERYDTLSMRFSPPRMLSETEAVAGADHQYRTGGTVRQTHVVFAFAREHGVWWIVGLDYTSPAAEAAAPAARPAAAIGGRAVVPAPAPDRLQLAAAPRARWSVLRAQSQPVLLATLKGVSGGRAVLYDLMGMRGIHPGTLAWALYRRGQPRPLEVGVLEPRGLRLSSWVAVGAVSPAAPQARLAAAERPGPALFPIRSLGSGLLLALGEAPLPGANIQRSAPRPPARKAKKA
jgi:hypothetical protein